MALPSACNGAFKGPPPRNGVSTMMARKLVAIWLVDSKGVFIENGRLRGIKTLVNAWDDKSAFSIVDVREKSR
jgi:hypothetical protein